jgi:hypothetical protein
LAKHSNQYDRDYSPIVDIVLDKHDLAPVSIPKQQEKTDRDEYEG